jgi:hypothetical protein
MWPRTVSPRKLRDALPDVSLRLESEQIKDDLQKLGIRFIGRRTKKSACFEIDMSPHHTLRITPVDRGIDQFAEWFSWYQETKEGREVVTTSIRCYATIKNNLDLKAPIYALTIHNDSMFDIIQCAIFNYKLFSGVEISPITTNKRNQSK